MKNHRASHRRFSVAENHQLFRGPQHRLLVSVNAAVGEPSDLLHGLSAGADGPGVVPRRQLLPGFGQVDGLDFSGVRADVGLPVFQLVQ